MTFPDYREACNPMLVRVVLIFSWLGVVENEPGAKATTQILNAIETSTTSGLQKNDAVETLRFRGLGPDHPSTILISCQ